MYQPMGAKLRLLGTVTVREVLLLELIGKSTNRCSVSQEWVVAIGLITQSLQVRPVGALFVLHFQWITALEERSWNLLGSIST